MHGITDKKKRLAALKSRQDIWQILNKLCKIIDNPILVHDMEYKVIAYSENKADDDPIWNEFINTGTVGPDRLEFYKTEMFLDTAANARKTAFLLSEKLKYDRIYGKLFSNHNNQIGCACMVACHSPFDSYTVELFEAACDILDENFKNSKYYQCYGQKILEELILMLIEEKITDRLLYTAHVESIYIGLKSNLFLAVVDISPLDPTFAKLSYFRGFFKRLFPDYKCVIYGNYLLIIMGTDSPELNKETAYLRLVKYIGGKDMLAGISSCFENLFELSKYYQEALSALRKGQNANHGGHIFLYDDTAR